MYIGDKWYTESEIAALAFQLTALLEEAMQIINEGLYCNYQTYDKIKELEEKIKSLP